MSATKKITRGHRRRNAYSVLLLCVLAFVFVCTPRPAAAGNEDALRQAKMKAGVIYHLAKLVIWEPDRFWGKEAPIVVGFAGESSEDIAEYFSSQAPRYKAQNRELVVRRLSIPNEDADPETIKMAAAAFAACHIVYVPEDREERVADLPGYAQMRGVLVVGETRAFTETRGMVGLDVVNKHFVIFANRKNIKHAGIEISAEFLQHAQAVGEDE